VTGIPTFLSRPADPYATRDPPLRRAVPHDDGANGGISLPRRELGRSASPSVPQDPLARKVLESSAS
jgi:hypothetical protein